MSVRAAELIGVQPVSQAAYDAVVSLGRTGLDAVPTKSDTFVDRKEVQSKKRSSAAEDTGERRRSARLR